MRTGFRISAIAVIAAMLATAPASALTLNLGGDDGLLGGNGGLLGLGGAGSTTNATINSGAAGTGSGGTDAVVNTDLLGGSNGSTATVDLGGSGGNRNLLGLFGSGDDPTTANLNLGDGGGGTNGNVLLDLFGPAGGVDNPNASVTLGSNGGTGVAGLNLLGGGTGGNGDVLLDLFGPGGGSGTGGGNGTGVSGGGTTGTGLGGNGRLAGGSDGARLQVASIDKTTGACFTPDATQAARLASRHNYDAQTFASWRGVANLKIVDIGVCPAAAPGLAARPNIGRLQAYIDTNATLKAGLARAGHSASEVVAVDKSGGTLVVYVM